MAQENNKIQKVPPHNIEAEQAVLGGVLIDKDAINKAVEVLAEDGSDFYHPAHAKLFRAMSALFKKNTPVDEITLTDIFKDSDVLTSVGGISYIGELVDSIPTAANISYYAKIVKKFSVKRNLLLKAMTIIDDITGGQVPLEEIIDKAQRDILSVSISTVAPYDHIKDLAIEVHEEMKRLHASGAGQYLSGLSTGFLFLNSVLGGLQKSDLIVVAGRPSQGKSAIVMQMASHIALQGYKVGIFPVEVGKKQLVKNILACQGRMNTNRFRDGDFKDLQKLERVVNTIRATNIFIDDVPRSSVEIRQQARKMKREHGLDVIFIDHLQAMREKGRFDNRNTETDFMVNGLKDMAKELDIPVVLTSQLNRECEKRIPPKPRLSDMRESGAIEQVADIIMSIYRPEYYDKDTKDKGIAEIELLKNRNGALGEFSLRWNRFCLRFENMGDELDVEMQGEDFSQVPF